MWTLYWKSGDREVIEGDTIAHAFTNAGYGYGALSALDFYVRGDDHSYFWNSVSWESV